MKILKLMFLYAVVYFTFANTITLAQAPDTALKDKPIPQIVEHFAKEYKVSSKVMLAIMQCESSLNPSVQSTYRYTRDNPKLGTYKGQRERSYGLSMIHLPAHPDVTKEEALDPIFASRFMAEHIAKGQAHIWSCYSVIKHKV